MTRRKKMIKLKNILLKEEMSPRENESLSLKDAWY